LRGPGRGTAYELVGITTIGRASTNKIQLRSKRVSREHARIEQRGSNFVAIDLDSRNGIYVNGKKATDHVLKPRDQLLVGSALLVYEPDYGIELGSKNGEPAVVYAEDASAATASLETALVHTEGADQGDTISYEGLLEANRKLKALYEVSDTIYSVLNLNELLRRVLDLVLRILRGDRGVILLYDDHTGALAPVAARQRKSGMPETGFLLKDLPVSSTIVDQVARELKAVLTADASVDPRFDESDSISAQNIRSVMCVPLLTHNKCHGLLYMDTSRPTRQFTEDDLRLLTTIARQAATAIDNARSYDSLRRETRELRRRISERYVIVGSCHEFKAVLSQAKKVAAGDSTVLIAGETGTGKELVARAIHEESARSSGPFVTVNCAAVPETLLESELFGHEKGAFTGAYKTKLGRFEVAHHGTIFLDEVGEVPLTVQSKLLRVVETKRFERVGGTQSVQADVRIIAATNRNLEESVRSGLFREDLYYRLAVVPITVPPLRRRRADIPELVGFFIKRYAQETGKRIKGISQAALAALCEYGWPGNVRELQNTIERTIILTDSETIELHDLPMGILATAPPEGKTVASKDGMNLSALVGETERRLIEQAMAKANGKKIEAARILGISRPTLDKKIKDYNLEA
jgi:Nif-specific regulatory protein